MKTIQTSLILLATTLLLQSNLTAQTFFEDFEDETAGSREFTSEGQEFTINPTLGETFDIGSLPNGGFNGESSDNFFIDNTGGVVVDNGSNLFFGTTDATDITIKSFFLFIATPFISNPDPFTLTIEGMRDGVVVYTIVKTDGFSNVETFIPDNGFTFIDFATEGDVDYSNVNINAVSIQTTGNADFMLLDALTWGPESNLSAGDFSLEGNNINVFPNPAIDAITVSGITERENYRIYNVLGAEIANGSISNNESINIQNLSSGLYLLDVDNGNNIKFLKE